MGTSVRWDAPCPPSSAPGANSRGGSTAGSHRYSIRSSSVAPMSRRYSSSINCAPLTAAGWPRGAHRCTTQSARMVAFLHPDERRRSGWS
eukprot:30285-Pelagococcus_subviridis.AAC.3